MFGYIFMTRQTVRVISVRVYIYSSHQNPFQTNHWLGMTQHQLEEKKFLRYGKIAKTNASNMIT